MHWKAETVLETCAQCRTELFALLQVLESVEGHETAEPEILGVTFAAVLTNLHALAQAIENTEQVAHVIQGSTVDRLRKERS